MNKKKAFIAVLSIVCVIIAIIVAAIVFKKYDDIILKISNKAKWGNDCTIESEEILSIGSDSIDDLNYYFGPIGDIAVDSSGAILVLDTDNQRVQKFSNDGRYLQTYGGLRGEGPGDFLKPRQIAVDSEDRLFVADSDQMRITVFGADGALLKMIKTTARPWDIEVGINSQIYITCLVNPAKQRIHRYDFESGKLVGTFCERNKETELAARSGNADNLCLDKDGNIYFCFFYPYEIRKLSPDGKLLARFNRRVEFLKKPTSHLGPILFHTSFKDIIYLPDGKLMTVIFQIDDFTKKKWRTLFDVFNEKGEWLCSIPSTLLGIDWYRVMTVDKNWNLYYDTLEPYPQVKKCSLKFLKEVRGK